MMRPVGLALAVVAALGAAPMGQLKPAPTYVGAVPASPRAGRTYAAAGRVVGAGFSRPDVAAPVLGDIYALSDFQAMFDAGRGAARIVLLLSPT